jgi:hypothetical protein
MAICKAGRAVAVLLCRVDAVAGMGGKSKDVGEEAKLHEGVEKCHIGKHEKS